MSLMPRGTTDSLKIYPQWATTGRSSAPSLGALFPCIRLAVWIEKESEFIVSNIESKERSEKKRSNACNLERESTCLESTKYGEF